MSKLCIVGTGPAGQTVARALRNFAPLILEAGSREFSFDTQQEGIFENCGLPIRSDKGPYTLEEIEEKAPFCRMEGGGHNVWKRKCTFLKEIDLLPREEIPYSGWPIPYAELKKQYRALQGETPEFISVSPKRNAPVVKITPLENGALLHLASGEELQVETVILACGTIENTRLLLDAGVQNAWLGKNLLDHPKAVVARCPCKKLPHRFSFSKEILLAEKLPNHRIDLHTHPAEPGILFLYLHLEQLPSQKSQITLSNEKNSYGRPKARLSWQIEEKELVEAKRFVELYAARFSLDLHYETDFTDPTFFRDAAHQLGTCKMAKSPDEGVTNPYGEVFGHKGLFVAGSALFPTAGNAHPTLTIVALANRLAEHLSEKL